MQKQIWTIAGILLVSIHAYAEEGVVDKVKDASVKGYHEAKDASVKVYDKAKDVSSKGYHQAKKAIVGDGKSSSDKKD